MTAVFNGALAKLFAGAAIIGVSDGDQDVSASVFKSRVAFTVTGAGASGRTVNLPAIGVERVTLWQADAANQYAVDIACGSGTVSLDPGQVVAIITDGTANGVMASELTGSVSTLAWQSVDDGDSPFQAAAGDHLDVDTSGGAVTIKLPADPAKYDEIWFRNSAQSFATHALTIDRNGETIMGVAEDMTVNTDGADFSLWFNGTTWQLPGAQL